MNKKAIFEAKSQWIRNVLCVLVMLVVSAAFVGCKHDDDDDDDDDDTVTLVYKYGYSLNNETSSGFKYHKVVKYGCIDNGDNTYEVKEYSIHRFSTENTSYTDRTGNELISMVKNNSRTADYSKVYTISKDTTNTITNSDSGTTYYYNIPSGLSYTIYLYY